MTWTLIGVFLVLVVLALVWPDAIDALTRLIWVVIKLPFVFAIWLFRRLIAEVAWRRLARAHGLRRRWWAAPGPGQLVGQVHGARLIVEVQRLSDDRAWHTRIRVEELSRALSLHRGEERGVLTGDATFDALATVTGGRTEVLAILDDPTRQAISALMQAGALRVHEGTLHWLGDGTTRGLQAMPERGRWVAKVVAALTDPTPPAHRLRRALLTTDHDGYRLEVWRALIASNALDPAWFRAHLDDASAQVWPLLAAYVAEDRDARLSTYAGDPAAPLALRLMAVDALPTLPSALGVAAARGPLVLTKRIHERYVARETTPPVAAIVAHLAEGPDGTRVFLLRWLASSDDPRAVGAALAHLTDAPAVVVGACEVLRALGGREALAALVEVRHHADPEVRAAAAAAIEAIRTRVGGQAGAVSVVDAAVGAVSVAEE